MSSDYDRLRHHIDGDAASDPPSDGSATPSSSSSSSSSGSGIVSLSGLDVDDGSAGSDDIEGLGTWGERDGDAGARRHVLDVQAMAAGEERRDVEARGREEAIAARGYESDSEDD